MWQSTNLFSQDGNTHPAETKKVPKDCHAYTWYPLTLLTILNSVCPGSPKEGAGTCRLARGLRTYRVCPACVPVYRCRIKINYGSILTQYLVLCQLDYTIYSIFIFSAFFLLKIFLTLFKIFSSFCIFPYLYFIDQLFNVVGSLFLDN